MPIAIATVFNTQLVVLYAAPCCFLGCVAGVGRTSDALFREALVGKVLVCETPVAAPALRSCISITEGREVGRVYLEEGDLLDAAAAVAGLVCASCWGVAKWLAAAVWEYAGGCGWFCAPPLKGIETHPSLMLLDTAPMVMVT
jgi:hypothetical protein